MLLLVLYKKSVEMKNIIAYPENENQLEALKDYLKSLHVKFQIEDETEYDEAFVEKILQGDKDLSEGKGRTVSID
jgi:adenylate kinase family enzyme